MTFQVAYNDLLCNARQRKGIDLEVAARDLHIRPDVLAAIEAADFSHMPPQGYARNMINAYSKYLGLNASEVTKLYTDEVYAQSIGAARSKERVSQAYSRSSYQGTASDNGRIHATNKFPHEEDGYDDGTVKGSSNTTHASKDSAVPSSRYTNFYSGNQPSFFEQYRPYIFIAAAVIVLIVVIVLVANALGQKEGTATTGNDVTISGLSDTSNPDIPSVNVENPRTPILIAPEKVNFIFVVPEGQAAYIEVYENGGVSVADTIYGPYERSFDITGSLSFVTTNPDGALLMLAGEQVYAQDNDGDGVWVYDVNFADYLQKWLAAHPQSAAAVA